MLFFEWVVEVIASTIEILMRYRCTPPGMFYWWMFLIVLINHGFRWYNAVLFTCSLIIFHKYIYEKRKNESFFVVRNMTDVCVKVLPFVLDFLRPKCFHEFYMTIVKDFHFYAPPFVELDWVFYYFLAIYIITPIKFTLEIFEEEIARFCFKVLRVVYIIYDFYFTNILPNLKRLVDFVEKLKSLSKEFWFHYSNKESLLHHFIFLCIVFFILFPTIALTIVTKILVAYWL